MRLDDKQYDQALATRDSKTDEAFAAIYADLRGDILSAAGKPVEAKAAYTLAMAKFDPKSPYRQCVQVKFEALGGSQ